MLRSAAPARSAPKTVPSGPNAEPSTPPATTPRVPSKPAAGPCLS